jgi:CRISPR-associated endonuclease/helicase Cas3
MLKSECPSNYLMLARHDRDEMESKIDYTAWGKLNRDRSDLYMHPLIDHMFDVAACFTALADCAAIRRAMTKAAGRELDETDISRLAAITFLHDIGKANAGFQSRRWIPPNRAPKNWPTAPFGHGPEGWALVTGKAGIISSPVLAGLPLDDMNAWGAEAVYCLLRASISHHGRPVLDEPRTQVAHIWQAVCSEMGEVLYDPARAVADMGHQILRAFPAAFASSKCELPANAAFAHLFAGLVQLADWLGSDTRSGFFPYSVPGEDRALTGPQRAQHAVRTIGLRVDTWRDALTVAPADFCATFQVAAPRPMQVAITLPDSQLVILEAETGSGKT